MAEAALVVCGEEEVDLWTVVDLEECSEVAEVDRGVFRGGCGMNRVGFGGRRQGHPGCLPGPLMEQIKER